MRFVFAILAIVAIIFSPLVLLFFTSGIQYNLPRFLEDFRELNTALIAFAIVASIGFVLFTKGFLKTRFILLISLLINIVAIEFVLIFFYTSLFDFSAFKISFDKLCGNGTYYAQYNPDYQKKLHNYCSIVDAVFGFKENQQH